MPVLRHLNLSSLLTVMACLTVGCTGNPGQSVAANETATSGNPSLAGTIQPAPRSFREWQQGFRAKAQASGISQGVLDRAFAGVTLNIRVLELDNRQPEFSRPIWEYLDSAVSNKRVRTGQRELNAKRQVLNRAADRFGVDPQVMLAIWGIETSFGGNFGSIPVIESMATLAYDGRRKKFAEEQLLAALRILQAGDITPGRMVGSWAGAMGHTQFIPTSFLEYAVDFTGDGKRDLWAADAVDALASTGNYLSRFGWQRDAPAAVEVRLPQGFDFALADGVSTRPASAWEDVGISGVNGPLPSSGKVAILLPAGARGPALAVYPNFKVIKRYNNSTSYALAVAQLADRIAGKRAIQTGWPREDRPLSRTEKQELQGLLTRLGFDTQGVDGIIGPNSRVAVRAFQKARGLVPDGYVSETLLNAVRRAAA
ncbi:MAG: lytic murein transglycosylase [Paracoccaceae bacterium]